MEFKDKCQACAARLLAESEADPSAPNPGRVDTRLCSKCHVFDDEEEEVKRIPSAYVNNPTDYL